MEAGYTDESSQLFDDYPAGEQSPHRARPSRSPLPGRWLCGGDCNDGRGEWYL